MKRKNTKKMDVAIQWDYLGGWKRSRKGVYTKGDQYTGLWEIRKLVKGWTPKLMGCHSRAVFKGEMGFGHHAPEAYQSPTLGHYASLAEAKERVQRVMGTPDWDNFLDNPKTMKIPSYRLAKAVYQTYYQWGREYPLSVDLYPYMDEFLHGSRPGLLKRLKEGKLKPAEDELPYALEFIERSANSAVGKHPNLSDWKKLPYGHPGRSLADSGHWPNQWWGYFHKVASKSTAIRDAAMAQAGRYNPKKRANRKKGHKFRRYDRIQYRDPYTDSFVSGQILDLDDYPYYLIRGSQDMVYGSGKAVRIAEKDIKKAGFGFFSNPRRRRNKDAVILHDTEAKPHHKGYRMYVPASKPPYSKADLQALCQDVVCKPSGRAQRTPTGRIRRPGSRAHLPISEYQEFTRWGRRAGHSMTEIGRLWRSRDRDKVWVRPDTPVGEAQQRLFNNRRKRRKKRNTRRKKR